MLAHSPNGQSDQTGPSKSQEPGVSLGLPQGADIQTPGPLSAAFIGTLAAGWITSIAAGTPTVMPALQVSVGSKKMFNNGILQNIFKKWRNLWLLVIVR